MHEYHISLFPQIVNQVAEEIHKETGSFENLAKLTYDKLRSDYVFYDEDTIKVKKTIQEQITLPDERVVSVPKEIEDWITKRKYKSIDTFFRGSLDPISSLSRVIDCATFHRPTLNHNPNDKVFIENAAKLFYNTDAYSVGDTLTNFRIFCQNIHKNLNTPGSEMSENKVLYQYSMKGGTGKSFFGKVVVEAIQRLGQEAGVTSIMGRWVGADFSKNIVSFIDEFMPPKGENKDFFITRFNPIVCNDEYEVEYKGVDKYCVKSISSLIINSNYLPFDSNLRRYGIIKYNEKDICSNNFKQPYDKEEMIEAFIRCLESVPFNKIWANPIKPTNSSLSKLIWMAREVENQVSFNIVSKQATIREFVNAYMNIDDKAGKHSRVGMTREVFDILISSEIQPVKRVNGDLMYSKYDFEAISKMSTIEDSIECPLDSIVNDIERTQAAFRMYLSDPIDPTDPTDPIDTYDGEESKLLEQGLVTEEPPKDSEVTSTDVYPEDFDMNTKQFTTYDAYHFGTPIFKTRFEKEGNLDVKGNEEFLCSSTYKATDFNGVMSRKGANMKPVFFVYESDDLTKEEQHLAIKPALQDPERRKHIFSVTDSGSKSIHVLVHIDPKYQEEALRSYKYYWKQVGEYIFGKEYMSKCDQNVASNARLTRMPGGTRDNGNLQKCFYINRKVEGIKFKDEWIYAVDESIRQEKEIEEQNRKCFRENREKFGQTDEMTTLNNFYKANPCKWEVAKTLVDGGDPGSGSNMIGAIGMLRKAGLFELVDVAKKVAHHYHPSNIPITTN